MRNYFFPDSFIKEINWIDFEAHLGNFIEAKILSQHKAYAKINRYLENNPNPKFMGLVTVNDASIFTIEIYDNQTRKVIYYEAPHYYLEELTKYNLPKYDYEVFVGFIDYLIETFDLNGLFEFGLEDLERRFEQREKN